MRSRISDEYKYLGAETGKVRGRWNSYIARIWSTTRKHCNQVLWMAGGRRGLRPRSLLHLWSVYCRPKVEYASELWEGVISESWASKLESLQTMVMRVALGAPDNASAVGMRAESGLQTLASRRWAARLTFFRKLATAPRGNLASIIFRCRCSQVDAGVATRSWCHRTKVLLSQLGLESWSTRGEVETSSSLAWYRKLGRSWMDDISWTCRDTWMTASLHAGSTTEDPTQAGMPPSHAPDRPAIRLAR